MLVEWNRHSEQSGMFEFKADQAEIRLPVKEIELGSCGHVRLKQPRVDRAVQYDKVVPLG